MSDWRIALITVFSVLGVILLLGVVTEVYMRFSAPLFDVANKHCLVTGGSQGLGKAVAEDLARRGAHVTIVARREPVLKEAVKEISKHAKNAKVQQFHYVTCNVTDHEECVQAISKAVELQQGKPIENVFSVAGLSNPGIFIEQTPNELKSIMDINYTGTLNIVHEVSKRMVENQVKDGHIVLVSSTLGFFGLIGYTGYCASKFAIRGLAEALRVEMLMYGINVHCYFPGTIFTPGYETENLTKPQITKDIEGADEGMTPEKCSEGLFRGLKRGEFAIATDPISMLFRCSTRGAMPNNNPVLDTFIAGLGWIAFVPWRMFVEYMVKNHAKNEVKEADGDNSKSKEE